MPYAKIEPSGCGIVKGVAKIRLDFYLNDTDPHYAEYGRVYVPDETSKEFKKGYKGEVDAEGNPVDFEDFQKWLDSLPHIWINTPFHSHKIWLPVGALDNSVKEQIESTLTYFYNFHQYCWDKELNFIDEWKKVPFKAGTIRQRFIKGDPKDLSAHEAKVADILSRKEEFQIGVSKVPPQDLNIGEKGTITIGSAATDRTSITTAGRTYIDYNNAADGDGTIDTVQIYPHATMSDVEVATFIDEGASPPYRDFSTRDSEAIGTVTAGAPDPDEFTGLSMDVLTGDFIGFYASSGTMESTLFSGSGYYLTGDYIPSSSESFSSYPQTNSLYGTGTGGGGGLSIPIAMHHYKLLARR